MRDGARLEARIALASLMGTTATYRIPTSWNPSSSPPDAVTASIGRIKWCRRRLVNRVSGKNWRIMPKCRPLEIGTDRVSSRKASAMTAWNGPGKPPDGFFAVILCPETAHQVTVARGAAVPLESQIAIALPPEEALESAGRHRRRRRPA